jgi:hypothetical protein
MKRRTGSERSSVAASAGNGATSAPGTRRRGETSRVQPTYGKVPRAAHAVRQPNGLELHGVCRKGKSYPVVQAAAVIGER